MDDLGNAHRCCQGYGCKEKVQKVAPELSHDGPISHEQGPLASHHSKALEIQKVWWWRSQPKRRLVLQSWRELLLEGTSFLGECELFDCIEANLVEEKLWWQYIYIYIPRWSGEAYIKTKNHQFWWRYITFPGRVKETSSDKTLHVF